MIVVSLATQRRLAAAVVGASMLVAGATGVALAADPVPAAPLTVRSVDTLAYPKVVSVLQGGTANPTVAVEGTKVTDAQVASASDAAVPIDVMFVLDTSKAMSTGYALDKAKKAIADFAYAKPGNIRVGVVAAGVAARIVVRPTTDARVIEQGVGTLVAAERSETSLRDGVSTALDVLGEDTTRQPNIVLITAGKDTASSSTLPAVRGDLIDAGATLFAALAKSGVLDRSLPDDLVGASGGTARVVDDPATLDTAVSALIQPIVEQRVITFTGAKDAKVVKITYAAGSETASASVVPYAFVRGTFVDPKSPEATSTVAPEFFRTTAGKLVGAALALVACVLFAVGLALILTRDRDGLDDVLRPYSDQPVVAAPVDEGAMAESRLVKRAVELTSKFAERRGLVSWLERALESADMPLRAGEALFFYLALAFVLFALSIVVSGSFVVALIVLGLLVMVPPAFLKYKAKRRRVKFQAMLPDTLQLMAGSLKAGYSMMQGLEAVSQEVEDPMGKELRRIVVESRLGRPLEESMEDAADRMSSPDFSWAVMAIRIQREVGGNLAELLLTVAETMVQRERLRRDVKALTAEGRVSAIVLGILPVALGFVMFAINPEYISVLFHKTVGQMMLVGSILLALAGFFWMKKTIEIDV